MPNKESYISSVYHVNYEDGTLDYFRLFFVREAFVQLAENTTSRNDRTCHSDVKVDLK